MRVSIIFTIFSVVVFLITLAVRTGNVWAATTTNTVATPSGKVISATGSAQNTTKDILDKINDKVAQISPTFKRVYHGKIRSLGTNTIMLTTDDGQVSVEISEGTTFTKIRAGQKTAIEFKNLQIGSDLTVYGIYDETSKILTARNVIDKIRRYAVFGKVTEVTKQAITLSLADNTTKQITFDSTFSLKKLGPKDGFVTARQSEIKTDSHLAVVGFYDDSETVLTVLRALLFPVLSQ